MLTILFGIFIALEAVDAFLTMWAINHGGFTEVNPLAAPIAGTWWLPVVKILPAIVAAIIILYLAGRWPHLKPVVCTGVIVVSCFLLVVVAGNIYEVFKQL